MLIAARHLDKGELFGAAKPLGGMLIFSGINIWLYLRRYEKALLANVQAAKVDSGIIPDRIRNE